MERDFRKLLEAQWEKGRFLCVGLDTDLEKLPDAVLGSGTRERLVAFNRAIVDATKDVVCAFKLNSAFYEAHGDEGWNALRETILYIHEAAPEVIVLLDAKRGDIDNTNESYAISAFDHLLADAITVNPYMGGEPLAPFFKRKDKGIIVLCHTSNPGAGEIQNLKIGDTSMGQSAGEELYKVVARLSASKWNSSGNVCVLVGATYPDELKEVRAIVGEMPILIAGIGAQNGDLEKMIAAGVDSRRKGLVVNVSRSIIFASRGADFAVAARAKAQELDGKIRQAIVR